MRVTQPHRTAERIRVTATARRSGTAIDPGGGHLQAAPIVSRSPASHPRNRRAATARGMRGMAARVVVSAVLGAMLLSAAADPAHAASTVVVAQVASVSDVFTNVRNWLVGILAGLATVFLTVGGVRYLMAGSDPGEVEKAKQAFKSAGWGYGLAALAPVIVEILKGIVGV
jgi:hypothetical protein